MEAFRKKSKLLSLLHGRSDHGTLLALALVRGNQKGWPWIDQNRSFVALKWVYLIMHVFLTVLFLLREMSTVSREHGTVRNNQEINNEVVRFHHHES